MDVLSQLQSHPMFRTFPPEELAEVVRAASPVDYEPGDACLARTDAGNIFGVLVSGRLEAVATADDAQRRHVGYIEPGECFGEMSLLTGTPTGTDVVALKKSQAIVFLQEAIAPIIAGNREAVQFLTRLITRRLSASAQTPASTPRAAPRYSLGASSAMRVLAISCRQGDVRYRLFDTASAQSSVYGFVAGIAQGRAVHIHQGAKGKAERRLAADSHEAAIESIFAILTDKSAGEIASASDLGVVGHRVIHGGAKFDSPTVINDEVKAEVRRLCPLAPLDNEYNLRGIEAAQKLAPSVPHVAVFDTSFHLNMPAAAQRYALPSDLAAQPELRRFGFHGISHEGAARSAAAYLGMSFDSLRLVSCHLGNGASLTAIDHGRSVDNTMGQTSLEGLVMGTRCGDVDPGLLLHLVADRKLDAAELRRRLFTESGLLGLSGISQDVLTVMQAAEDGNPQALLALQVYCLRGRKYLAAYIGLLGGADAVIFTGGVGENAPGARARFCQGLQWLGITLNEEKNRSVRVKPGEAAEISESNSRARVLVVGGDEERTIAAHAVQAVSRRRVTDVIRSKQKRIPIGVSAHHLHLTQAHVEALFGPGHQLTWYADLSQPGQYACQEQVSLVGPKNRIDRVRVLGPIRPESQVEIARTEEFKLGIDAPVRLSGDLDGTPGTTLEGPSGQVRLERGVICAKRHIHMTPQDAMELAVRDRDVVRIRVEGPRSLIFGDVAVRVHPDFRLEMHLDTDESNAAELGKDAYGYLDSIQERASG